jgi:phosphatidylglycerol:prolipoprotein diacylglycerol transferase
MLMQYGALPRHPRSYMSFCWKALSCSPCCGFTAASRAPWQVSAVFLIGYGLARFVSEFFRNPDAGIFGHSYTISMGQWLSLPMIIIGVVLLVLFGKRQQR